jgi:hypothetical protein
LKLKSEILSDQNGKIISIEEFVYNDIGKVVRQDYKDDTGNRKFYKTFEYDTNGNCIRTCEFADNNEIQVSFEYSYDNNNNQIKTIERTADGSIWDWTEIIMQPNSNLKVWLAKDENGNIIHKTEENLLDHSERRYNDKGKLYLYELYKREFDTLNRLIEETVTNENGEEKRKNLYSYDGQKEIWTFISEGKFIKTEEKVYDNNRNLTYYIRKDSDGNCLEWYGFEFDKFGNKTKYFWGQEEGKQVGYKTFERTYD